MLYLLFTKETLKWSRIIGESIKLKTQFCVTSPSPGESGKRVIKRRRRGRRARREGAHHLVWDRKERHRVKELLETLGIEEVGMKSWHTHNSIQTDSGSQFLSQLTYISLLCFDAITITCLVQGRQRTWSWWGGEAVEARKRWQGYRQELSSGGELVLYP